jgi:hypothetical protein
MFEAETENFIKGNGEPAQLATFDEYGETPLGDIYVLFNGATITQGADGEAILTDSPNVNVYLPALEALAGGEIGDRHAIIVRGKTYPVRVEPRKNAHGLANIELRKALA